VFKDKKAFHFFNNGFILIERQAEEIGKDDSSDEFCVLWRPSLQSVYPNPLFGLKTTIEVLIRPFPGHKLEILLVTG